MSRESRLTRLLFFTMISHAGAWRCRKTQSNLLQPAFEENLVFIFWPEKMSDFTVVGKRKRRLSEETYRWVNNGHDTILKCKLILYERKILMGDNEEKQVCRFFPSGSWRWWREREGKETRKERVRRQGRKSTCGSSTPLDSRGKKSLEQSSHLQNFTRLLSCFFHTAQTISLCNCEGNSLINR